MPSWSVNLRWDEDSMQQFIQDSLCNLENNTSFYLSMRTPPIIPSLDVFNLLHPEIETQSKPQPSIINEIDHKDDTFLSYVHRVTSTPINLEESFGQGFKILSK